MLEVCIDTFEAYWIICRIKTKTGLSILLALDGIVFAYR